MNEEFYAQTFPLTPGLVIYRDEIFGLRSSMSIEYPGINIGCGSDCAGDVTTTFNPATGVLTITVGGVASTVTIPPSGGASAPITCASIAALYSSGAALASDELLTKNCKSVKISELPISPAQLTPGALPSGVTVSLSQLTTGSLPVGVTISPTEIAPGTLPSSVKVSCASFTASPGSPTATDEVLTIGCKTLKIAQRKSSLGTLLPSWELAA